jgi:patatin-like phospholipase/acyl hydrolase
MGKGQGNGRGGIGTLQGFELNRKRPSALVTRRWLFLEIAASKNFMGTSSISHFRILALDGGGIKGTFTAAVLANWENATGLRVKDHFDLITGTSTGGILAIGLGLGISAQEMLDFYKKRGPIIFPDTGFSRRFLRTLRQIIAPKFSQKVLRRELKSAFRDYKFGEARVRLLIPAYDTLRGRIFLFKTAHAAHFRHDVEVPAVDVALATAAAPTYFKAAKIAEHEGCGYVDGGVWANCPALAGIIEAVHFMGKRLDELDVCSIGTTCAPDSVRELAGAGLFRWGQKVVSLIMNAQVEAAHKQAMLLVGQHRFLRVNCVTRPGDYSLDSASEAEALAGLGRSVAVERDILERVKERFLNGVKAEPFEPVLQSAS